MEEQEWKHCSKWLIRCSILPQDHKVTSAKATVVDLAQNLRDGVLLCLLLNKLSPGAVDKNDISQRPQMSQFLCLKNIRTFLQTCENRFGLKPESLFDPYQLFELTDFARVIATLSKLSKSPAALKTIAPGFPPESFRSGSKYDDEEIYMHLEHFANENCIEDSQLDDVYDVVNAEDPEEIYEEMCKTSRPKKDSGVFSPVTKRDYCAQELVETEKNYVDALNMIHKNFYLPLRGFVPKEDRERIFMNIEDLRSLHISFYEDLQKNYPDNISGCFERHRDKFLIYGHYCSLLTKAQDHIQSITSKNEQIKSKIQECEKMAKDGKFRLRDILSVPMQRILKYPLLLRDLHKYTVDPHSDREGLAAALETMQDVAKYINEVKRDNETINTILEIQRSITDINMPLNTYLTDYGKLQRDGVLRIKAHEDQNSRQRTRHVFLFDKVMLMCKPHGEEFRYKRALDLAKYKVEDRVTSDTGNWGHQFVLSDISNNHAYTCYAKTLEMKRKWVDAIRLALENTIPPYSRTASHEFTLQTFSEPTVCSVCRKLLYGIFFQGYRCNRTDTNAHKDCIVKCTMESSGQVAVAAGGGGGNGAGYISNNASSPCPPPPPPPTAICRARAIATYKGDPSPGLDLDTLTFIEGETIEVLSKCDKFWWQGRMAKTPPIGGGCGGDAGAMGVDQVPEKPGFFPAHFVKELAHGRSSVPQSPQAIDSTVLFGGGGGHAMNNGHVSPGFVSPGVKNDPLSPSQRMNILNPPSQLQQQQQQQNPHQRRHSLLQQQQQKSAEDERSELMGYSWFARQMERLQAEEALKNAAQGTFMIRESVRTGGFALSLVYGDDVKHIKIQVSNTEGLYFLADVKFFASIPKLVDHYSRISLVGSFPGLDTVLKYPYHQMPANSPKVSIKILSYAIAMYDFTPTDTNQLALRRGDRLAVVSKAGDDRGWWKGQVQVSGASKKIGYFPKKYVKELRDDFAASSFALPNFSHA